jgi:hypothetical protein
VVRDTERGRDHAKRRPAGDLRGVHQGAVEVIELIRFNVHPAGGSWSPPPTGAAAPCG